LIVYQATKSQFVNTVFTHDIESVILKEFRQKMGRGVARQEIWSWKESLLAIAKVLNDVSIPDDCGIAVEYGIPQTSKRIDLLLSGRDKTRRSNLLIVELKQWETVKRTPMDAIVRTRFAHGETDCSHPSYQSWSYAELLRNFNETVYSDDVPLHPCAYLHNCKDGGELLDIPQSDAFAVADHQIAHIYVAQPGLIDEVHDRQPEGLRQVDEPCHLVRAVRGRTTGSATLIFIETAGEKDRLSAFFCLRHLFDGPDVCRKDGRRQRKHNRLFIALAFQDPFDCRGQFAVFDRD